MGRFRTSIARLLGVVLFVAVALAALRSANDSWDSGVLAVTLLILLTAILMAVHRTGRRRASSVGFALFGWVYLAASLIPAVEPRLPTTRLLSYLESKRPKQELPSGYLYQTLVPGNPGGANPLQPVLPDLTGAAAVDWAYNGQVPRDWSYPWQFTRLAPPGPSSTAEDFIRIGHSLLALVVASIGSRLSRRLHDGNHLAIADRADDQSEDRRLP
jgi:hypothetical protein